MEGAGEGRGERYIFTRNSFPEITDDRKNYNMTALMGRKGDILRTYRKQKPTKPGECDSGDANQSNVVWTDLGNLGILICFGIQINDHYFRNRLHLHLLATHLFVKAI